VLPGVDDGKATPAFIPWQALNIKPVAGQESCSTHDSANGRDRQLMWNGTDKNSTDRSLTGPD